MKKGNTILLFQKSIFSVVAFNRETLLPFNYESFNSLISQVSIYALKRLLTHLGR